MASKYALRIVASGVDFDASLRRADLLSEVWRRERQLQLTRQLAINAEVRKRWIEADPFELKELRGEEHPKRPVAVRAENGAATKVRRFLSILSNTGQKKTTFEDLSSRLN